MQVSEKEEKKTRRERERGARVYRSAVGAARAVSLEKNCVLAIYINLHVHSRYL